MSEHNAKRRRLASDEPADGEDGSNKHDDVIARLLQASSSRQGTSNRRSQATPIIRDNDDRPSFEMPDLTASSSLLARVQSFLPQLQQANTTLKDVNLQAGQMDNNGFELIEQSSDDEEKHDGDSEDATSTSGSESSVTSSSSGQESEGEDDDDDDQSGSADNDIEAMSDVTGVSAAGVYSDPRQIVMNLALGVFEPQGGVAGHEDSSEKGFSQRDSSQTSSASIATNETRAIKDLTQSPADDLPRLKVEGGPSDLDAPRIAVNEGLGPQQKRGLIQELS